MTGAAALAGCTGGDDEGNGDDGNGDDDGNGNGAIEADGDVDVWFETGNWDDPTNVQFNPFNPAALGGQLDEALWEEYAKYNLEHGEWIPYAVTEWDIGEETVTFEIRDDLVWSDGEDVTAEDIVVGMRLDEYQDGEIWDFAESVEAVDDTTVEITLEDTANQEVVEWVLLTRNVNTPEHVFGEYLDRIDDGEDPEDVMGDLATWDDREPVTCGPFYFSDEESTNQHMTAPAMDDHPDADEINFNGYHMYERGSNEAYHSSLIDGEFDGLLSLFVSSELLQTFPDTVDEIQIPGTFGAGIIFNHDHDIFSEREVRQAMAFATDWELAAQNADPESKQVPAVPCGITTAAIEDYLGDDIDDYESYDQDQDRAAELLEDAGFEQDDNGDWVDSSGDTISATIVYPSGWSDFVAAAETVASQLNEFGFDLELEGQERGTLEENLGNSDFELANFEWNEGAIQFNHPYYSLRHNFRNRQLDPDTSFFNYPESDTIEVPARDGDGTIEVDVVQRLNDLASESDEDEANEIIKELAWVVNQDMPMLPIQSKFEQSFLSNDGWEYPDPESDDMQILFPLYWLPKQGQLKATEE
ncbi:ABC transporter substrate-binding protein [Halobacteria archaeon AArc-m2/3/4]|uniref:ABC transporter substrate-binding protein n=1 Tax=Natronoglomus mannanivorans TaxID=2979990 RepID=A0AAP3E170_9EURY|nr:ABC transporter substrate-binding protein [Halobacteria archaeon AArc-xg1-1]MCU4972559.1 ABC transporter substrate-binding protein [Halobacteria archaeon AArc-m2/3/4]